MRTEKILRREDGSRVKITVEYYTERYMQKQGYSTLVFTCEEGKRTWKPSFDGDCYRYCTLSLEDRKVFEEESQLNHVTEEELLDAKMLLWKMMKPE